MARGNGNAVSELRALVFFVVVAALLPTTLTVLWNVEIPRPPAKTDFAPCDARRGGHPANLNVTLLLAATHQGVRESSKYLQKHGFQKSKYENVTWPRLRRRPGARDFEMVAYASQFATEYIARRLKLKADNVHKFVACTDVGDTALGRICPKDLTDDYVCPRKALRYRTADGSCNNFDQPWRGATFSTLVRLLPARYADGISRPRTSTGGSPLPSGRSVSQTLSGRTASPEEPRATLMLMQWGQFVDHDVSLTTLSVSRSGFPPKCCRPLMSPEDVHPECLAVPVAWRDSFYRKFGSTCMEFSRSAPAAKRDCRHASDTGSERVQTIVTSRFRS